jgi:hypothetical protein
MASALTASSSLNASLTLNSIGTEAIAGNRRRGSTPRDRFPDATR